MKNVYYVAAGALAMAILLIPALILFGVNGGKVANIGGLKSGKFGLPVFETKITKVDPKAFGSVSGPVNPELSSARSRVAAGMSVAESAPKTPIGNDFSFMPPEDVVQYKYVYKGESLSLNNGELEVYRRVKKVSSKNNLIEAINSVNLGIINLASFTSQNLQSFSLLEDRDFGYILSINLEEGMISINENWVRWKLSETECMGDQCLNSPILKAGDVPDDTALINIAKSFVSSHGIDLSNFGEPEVANEWREEYAKSADKENFSVPSMINIIFPLKLNGQYVYNEGGAKVGMGININTREKKVLSVQELTTQHYEKSSYEAERDFNKILKIAEKGGVFGYADDIPNAKILEIELGKPEYALMKMYQQSDGANEELFVPALVFPVTKVPDGGPIWQKNIVVPLSKETLAQYEDLDSKMPVKPLEEAVSNPGEAVASPSKVNKPDFKN